MKLKKINKLLCQTEMPFLCAVDKGDGMAFMAAVEDDEMAQAMILKIIAAYCDRNNAGTSFKDFWSGLKEFGDDVVHMHDLIVNSDFNFEKLRKEMKNDD